MMRLISNARELVKGPDDNDVLCVAARRLPSSRDVFTKTAAIMKMTLLFGFAVVGERSSRAESSSSWLPLDYFSFPITTTFQDRPHSKSYVGSTERPGSEALFTAGRKSVYDVYVALSPKKYEENGHAPLKVSLDPKNDLDPVTLDEVKVLVKNLNIRKRPGLDGTGVQLAMFADDTTLFRGSDSLNHIISHLQRAINELTQWFQLWRIERFQPASRPLVTLHAEVIRADHP
ncbi:hypothetical protein EVAR_13859_1 [Eumeta japonica]|uniref:Uncharacterized protein n=1 Tax=Eumeta variegata TaxID=151549 RepID=A0A4C1U1M2_EUMVA|nr:hypothetical protein EVAR_13859_1 [Eumeta japonica]